MWVLTPHPLRKQALRGAISDFVPLVPQEALTGRGEMGCFRSSFARSERRQQQVWNKARHSGLAASRLFG